ncbi:MAG: 3-isopropylmalate dehydrogenase [Candidatus Atribacteria bacterium]|nr:MAG: 3-isopropylmalate dehydrogenase [Candidatus Atribacteria bacterium]
MTLSRIVILPGDGVGPEVIHEGIKVLQAVADTFGHQFELSEHLMGGVAIDATGSPLPDETLAACRMADAVLLGAIGGPKWSDPTAAVRPEQGLLGLRAELSLYANLRPVRLSQALVAASPLRPERIQGTDLVVVRELTGGIYFGPRQEPSHDGIAFDTMIYSKPEIVRIAHVAFRLASKRRGLVTSIDKANVLASGRLWRSTVTEVAEAYPDVRLEHQLVDSAAMHLLRRAASFDVMLTPNMFGDILSDEASMLTGSLGMLPSASLGEGTLGVYEPVHGSAPDIAGQGIANPIGTILSVALLLRHSLGLEDEAEAVERAVDAALDAGHRTADLAESGQRSVGTAEMGDVIAAGIREIGKRGT